MCECTRFPFYAHKLPSTSGLPVEPLPPAVSQLCLPCVGWFTSHYFAGGTLSSFWTSELEDERKKYYLPYYTHEEEAGIMSDENNLK